jgi:hypothetical protein
MSDGLLTVSAPVRSGPVDPAALLAAADAEADAVADRLHDGALQALVVARYAADAAVRGADPALARDAVQEALVALRRAVWSLRPRGGDDLPAALAELSKRRAEADALPLALELDAEVAAALSPACRTAAFGFVQAALPADGPAVVGLRRHAGLAALSVSGVPEDAAGWTARAAALGGHLAVDGSAARLLLPLLDDDTEGDR